jgi:AraC-like DNA-binding protein
MSQTEQVISCLKKALKANGLTYAQVAENLSLSEASVKRIFAEKSMSVQRMMQICEMMEMRLTDLAQLMNESDAAISSLSKEQEQNIVDDIVMLLITVCVLNRWSMAEIIAHFKISETDCIQYLAKLDRLKIIDLKPGNSFKLRVATNFKWIDGGPIQQFFQRYIEAEFFHANFGGRREKLQVLNGLLSDSSYTDLTRKMAMLAREFDALNDADSHLPVGERSTVTLVMATRPWRYSLYEDLRKK